MQPRDDHNPQGDPGHDAPPALITALKRLSQEPLFIPPTIDETIRRAAERHLAKPAPAPRFTFWRWATAAAAVTVLILSLFIAKFAFQPTSSADPLLAAHDLNQDGTVDILDAFALARQPQPASANKPALDLNHDGAVDQRDAAALAAEIVKLDKPSRS